MDNKNEHYTVGALWRSREAIGLIRKDKTHFFASWEQTQQTASDVQPPPE